MKGEYKMKANEYLTQKLIEIIKQQNQIKTGNLPKAKKTSELSKLAALKKFVEKCLVELGGEN